VKAYGSRVSKLRWDFIPLTSRAHTGESASVVRNDGHVGNPHGIRRPDAFAFVASKLRLYRQTPGSGHGRVNHARHLNVPNFVVRALSAVSSRLSTCDEFVLRGLSARSGGRRQLRSASATCPKVSVDEFAVFEITPFDARHDALSSPSAAPRPEAASREPGRRCAAVPSLADTLASKHTLHAECGQCPNSRGFSSSRIPFFREKLGKRRHRALSISLMIISGRNRRRRCAPSVTLAGTPAGRHLCGQLIMLRQIEANPRRQRAGGHFEKSRRMRQPRREARHPTPPWPEFRPRDGSPRECPGKSRSGR